MNKIYVPITGPTETKSALKRAVHLARAYNMELVAINVIDQESIAKLQRYKIFIEEESSMFTDSMKKDAEKYLNYAKKIGEQHGVRVSTTLLEGDPFSEIFEYIRNDKSSADLVCIAPKTEGELLKDRFGAIEKKLLLKTGFDFIIAGEGEEE